jgi:hypothetical protein
MKRTLMMTSTAVQRQDCKHLEKKMQRAEHVVILNEPHCDFRTKQPATSLSRDCLLQRKPSWAAYNVQIAVPCGTKG